MQISNTFFIRWANSLKIPVFSIDYPKAPANPYPAAINACWQAYNWILDHVEDIFSMNLNILEILYRKKV